MQDEMNEKLAVFRAPTILECIVCDSIKDISNFSKNNNPCAGKVGDKNA